MSSQAEGKCGALFYNAKELEALLTTVKWMVHPQPATEIITDRSTSDEIMIITIEQKRTKAIYMRFYWVRDQVEQKDFDVQLKPVHMNLED